MADENTVARDARLLQFDDELANAAMLGDAASVRRLIAAGADPMNTGARATSVTLASIGGHAACVEAMLPAAGIWRRGVAKHEVAVARSMGRSTIAELIEGYALAIRERKSLSSASAGAKKTARLRAGL